MRLVYENVKLGASHRMWKIKNVETEARNN